MSLNNGSLGKWLLFFALLVIAGANIQPAEANVPSGYQSFYVLGNSTKIILEAVDPAVGLPTSGANPYSVFSVVSYQNDTRIYVDQRGNGYSFQKTDFTGADAVFRLDKGGVITFDNWASPYYTVTPPGSGALLSGSLNNPGAVGVDGGDCFFVAGGPLSVFRGATDRRTETGDGNYIAGMWELYPVEQGGDEAQKSYIVPAGENTTGTEDFLGGGEVNGGTFAVVQSTEDDTEVNYTLKGVPGTRTLSRGESFVLAHVNERDTIVANKKIQVGLIASGGESYDIRYFTLKDERFTGNDFLVPTFPSGSSTLDIRYHIHAITEAHVTIETDSGFVAGWSPRLLSAGTTDASFTTAGGTPVHVTAEDGERITILVSVDTGEGDRDWGYVPIDAGTLVNEYFVPYAPSGQASSHDMQLYVMPIYSGTTIYADYNQDGVVEDSVTLFHIESHGFYDASDMDNTGTHLFADFAFTVVYGESALAQAGGATPGYDWGYTIIPLDYTPANIVLDIMKTAYPPTVSTTHNVTFTLTVSSGENNVFTVLDVNVTDELPPGFGYIGPTKVNHTDGSISWMDPDISDGTLAWNLSEDMQPGEIITLVFNSTPATEYAENYIDTGRARGRDPFGNIYTPEATAFVTVAPMGVIAGYVTDVTLATPVPVPGVTVELLNCTGSTPTIINATTTDGNGLYDFVGLTAGFYCVRYGPLDPALGFLVPFSDDDPTEPSSAPLTSSDNFTLCADCTYIHSFQVATPVDLYIEKSGPASTVVGQTVTYTYTVGNLGFTAATGVTVLDDVCGAPAYVSGDMDLDGELDIDEVWTYTCNCTVTGTAPNPLVNVVEVTSIQPDLDPLDNVDTWSIDLYTAGIQVEKELVEPGDGEACIGETVYFTVTVTNNGTIPLETVPLTDAYDSSKLDYTGADPAPDNVDEALGVLEWVDLTGPGSLGPGLTIAVEVNFTAEASTQPGHTVNLGEVVNAKTLDFENYVNGSDTAEASVVGVGIVVEKELKEPAVGYADIGDAVVFTVNVTNPGDLPIQTVPLKDTYDPSKLGYVDAAPPPDSVDTVAGVLEWTDPTGPGALPPGGWASVEISFEALEYTDYQGTVDLAEVIEAYVGDDVYLNGSDTASVVILSPVGGEVHLTPMQTVSPYLAAALVAASALALRRRMGP